MFNYFRKCSSNANQVCCEYSPTKGLWLYSFLSPIILTFTQGHNSVSTCTIIVIYIRQYLSYRIQTWHDVDLYIACMLMLVSVTLMQGDSVSAVSNEHWTCRVGHFLHDLDFENISMRANRLMSCTNFPMIIKVPRHLFRGALQRGVGSN